MSITCKRCRLPKDEADFRVARRMDRGGKEYRRSTCRPCELEYNAIRRGDRGRAYNLQFRYGMTPEEYDRLLEAQKGGCANCASADPGRGQKYFNIDHDHSCCPGGNRVRTCGNCTRGLLCHNCNVILGLAHDNPDRLVSLVAYLNRARENAKWWLGAS